MYLGTVLVVLGSQEVLKSYPQNGSKKNNLSAQTQCRNSVCGQLLQITNIVSALILFF